MLPIIVWLAGVMTAAASQSDSEVREDALRQRLGLGGKPPLRRHVPMPGGVTIWAWPDGDRIVRLVTMFEVEVTIKLFSDGLYQESLAYDAVSVDDDEETEPSAPDTSVFVYLDVNNRAQAFMIFDGTGLNDMAGTGDHEEISSQKVRSRIYQFLRDHDVDQMSEEDAKVLWYDDILIPSGLLESMDALDTEIIEHGFDDSVLHPFFAEIRKEHGREVRDYVQAYYELKKAVDQLTLQMGNIHYIERMKPTSKAFLEHLEKSGRIDDIVDRLGIDEDLIRQALSEGPDAEEALEDAMAQGFYPRDEHRMEVQGAYEDLSALGIFQELDSAAKNEAEELNLLMPHHGLSEAHRSRHDRLRYELFPEGWRSIDDPILDPLTHHLSDHYFDPSWIAQGHRSSNPKEQPGFLRALQAAGHFETAPELYDKAPEDLVWEWPGPPKTEHMEALILLGTLDIDPRMDLGDFLTTSYDQGLLTPHQIDYWRNYLISTGRSVRPPMVQP